MNPTDYAKTLYDWHNDVDGFCVRVVDNPFPQDAAEITVCYDFDMDDHMDVMQSIERALGLKVVEETLSGRVGVETQSSKVEAA